MSFLLRISSNLQGFDGTTVVPPSGFDYNRVAQNFYDANNNTGAPVGVIDPLNMLQAIEDADGALFDRATVEAGSPIKISDVMVERAIFVSAQQVTTTVGTHTPPLLGNQNGFSLFETATPIPATLTPNVIQYGGSGVISEDQNLGPGGCVTLPTGMRYFINSEADPQDGVAQLLLWLVPFKSPQVFAASCCCASGVQQVGDD